MATADSGNISFIGRIKRSFSKTGRFFRDVYLELQRVSWPSHQETYAFTVVVIIAIVAVSVWVGAWDLIFTWLLTLLNR